MVATKLFQVVFPLMSTLSREAIPKKGTPMKSSIQWFRLYRVDLAALLVVAIWGVSFPFRKAALAEFDVLPFTALVPQSQSA